MGRFFRTLGGFVQATAQLVLRALFRRQRVHEIRAQRLARAGSAADAWQNSLESAQRFANRMALASPGYRGLLSRRGVGLPITAESWRDLPLLTKDDFRRDAESWYGAPAVQQNVIWTFTSGSTGEPFKFPVTQEASEAESAAQELNLMAVGWRRHMGRATLKVEPKPPTGLLKLGYALVGRHEIGFTAADFRMEHVPAMVDRLRRERISYLRGYSSSIHLFAQEVLRRGLECKIPLVTTLGEGLSQRQAQDVERAFGATVYRDYGGSEAMHIGFECGAQNGYHVDLARFYVEILREDGVATEPGETGNIIVTAFRNDAMPLVRYRIGDLGSWAVDRAPCPCGNHFPRFAEVLGRSSDLVITPAGRVVNTPLLVVVFEYAQEHIVQFKVIQESVDRFLVLWVARHDRAAEHVPGLQQQLAVAFGGGVSFEWQQVAEISSERSGKRRIFVPLGSAVGATHS